MNTLLEREDEDVLLPDGTRRVLRGNDEIELPAGGVFELHRLGGGGWGKMG